LATSPTSKSATTSGAAKDDTLGDDGHFTFTYDELVVKLLANDPGGAAKVDITKQFFFGDNATGNHNLQDQNNYLASHGITNDGHGNYTIGADATDIDYFVQIGNKGTWSEAHVDVTAPVPHAGAELFSENFDGYAGSAITDPSNGTAVAEVTDLNAAHGWTGAQHTELGANGYGGIAATSGGASGFWFDTQNSPGGADISHTFTDTTAAVGGTTSVLSFDIGTQNLTFNGQTYATATDASFEFRIDGNAVATFHASDFATPDQLQHFDVNIAASAYGAGNTHTLELVDTSAAPGFTGFAVDSVHVHDWIV
jgi:hypothetical protein